MADEKRDAESEERTDEGGANAPDERREGDGQHYVDRDQLDFDPDDGLLSGTALDGNSDIPGPHQEGDDESDDADESEDAGGSGEDEPARDPDRPLPHPRED